jgi:hypothetical protein
LYGTYENFQSKSVVLTSQLLNFKDLIDGSVINLPFDGWDYVLNNIVNKQPLSLYQNANEIIIDSKDYTNYLYGYTKKETPKGYFCVFTSNIKKDLFRCGYDFTNKKIGYFDRIEKNIIESTMYGYRSTTETVALSIDRLENIENELNFIDAVVVFVVPKSPLSKILSKQSLHLLEIKDVSIDRLKITYPNINKEDIYLKSIFEGDNVKISSDSASPNLLYTNLMQVKLQNIETFITRLTISPDNLDQEYRCIGSRTITNKHECESPYDRFGEPKSGPTVWDKPCSKDEECPYYQANKNYPNNRGGCIKGACEVPLGVLTTGYTKFDDRNPYQPFCYRCIDPWDKNCCERQADLIKQGNSSLASPDYAFSNDTDERLLNNLPTTILI